MSNTPLSAEMQQKYNAYYGEEAFAFRTLGAIWKAENIAKLLRQTGKENLAGQKVLDIGAGDGAVAEALIQKHGFTDITCVDISETGLQVTRNRNLKEITEIKPFDGYTLPYADNAFAFGYTSHVLEHVEHERLFLKEAARVCQVLFVEVPLEDTVRMKADYRETALGHINFYRPKTLRHLLQSTGLRVLAQDMFAPPLAVQQFHRGKLKGMITHAVRWPLDKLCPSLSAKIFNYHGGVLCEKASPQP